MKKENLVTIGNKTYKLVEVEEEVKKPEPKLGLRYVLVNYRTYTGNVYAITDRSSCELADGEYKVNNDIINVSTITAAQMNVLKKGAMQYEGFFSGMIDTITGRSKPRSANSSSANNKTRITVGSKKHNNVKYNDLVLQLRPDFMQAVELLKAGFSMTDVAKMTTLSYSTIHRINVSFCGYKKRKVEKDFVQYKGKVYKCDGKKVNDDLEHPKSKRIYYGNEILIQHPEYQDAVALMLAGYKTTEAAEMTGITRQTAYKLNCTFCGHLAKSQAKKFHSTDKMTNVSEIETIFYEKKKYK